MSYKEDQRNGVIAEGQYEMSREGPGQHLSWQSDVGACKYNVYCLLCLGKCSQFSLFAAVMLCVVATNTELMITELLPLGETGLEFQEPLISFLIDKS